MDAIVTKNDLKSNAKTESISLLNARLADAIDLALITKQAHWNVKGPQFIAIHEMLDTFREEIDGHVDTIAERAVQLGGTAHGTSQDVSKATALKPYPTDIHKTKDHLAALIDRYAAAAKRGDRRGGGCRRCRHSRYLHRLFALARQAVVVPRSAHTGKGISLGTVRLQPAIAWP
jgi:starvation-inducible DNA-binding protein